jgi:triacylglycerol esterase/lipase EstA (alpha/beta hydrolase family)
MGVFRAWLLFLFFLFFSELGYAQSNRTDEFLSSWEALKEEEVVEQLKAYRLLFVPGFLSDQFFLIGKIPFIKKIWLGKYFDDQVDWLVERGVEAQVVDVESEAGPEVNAIRIRDEISSKDDKPVLLIGHSKGNLDALYAFFNHPELAGRVKAWISLQGAFYGSPVADWVDNHKHLGRFAAWVLKKMGGSGASLRSLRTDERESFMLRYRPALIELADQVPILSFGSYLFKRKWRIQTLLCLPWKCMIKNGHSQNDGLVPIHSTKFPGADFVSVNGIDHADPVMHSWVRRYDRLRMTLTLCGMMLAGLEF